MPAPPRLAYDAIYHIWNRGVNHSTIFLEDDNYRYFLKLYVKHIEPVAETYAYCLLPNHFHFLIRTRTAEAQAAYRQAEQLGLATIIPPSQAFSNLFNAYVRAFNKRHNRTGGLFEDRFGRKQVSTDGYLSHLTVYIHQNPLKHGLVDDIRDWRYGSYDALAHERPTRLQRDEVISWFGTAERFAAAHATTIRDLHDRLHRHRPTPLKHLYRPPRRRVVLRRPDPHSNAAALCVYGRPRLRSVDGDDSMTTRIIVELPDAVYRRIETLARESRRAVTDVVADVVTRSMQPYPVDPKREAMQRETDAFRRLHAALWRDFPGQVVALTGGEVVDHDLDPVALLRRVQQAYPGRTVLRRKVEQSPETILHFRSPRLAAPQ